MTGKAEDKDVKMKGEGKVVQETKTSENLKNRGKNWEHEDGATKLMELGRTIRQENDNEGKGEEGQVEVSGAMQEDQEIKIRGKVALRPKWAKTNLANDDKGQEEEEATTKGGDNKKMRTRKKKVIETKVAKKLMYANTAKAPVG
jgi:hypothetical protein